MDNEAQDRTPAIPTEQLLRTLEMGIISIVHYGLNTYTDLEWGFGDVSPSVFNPQKLDVSQWMEAAKAGGIRRMVFVCKHHDGFCLWPSKLNKDYSIANSPWKGGKGNLVQEVHDAAKSAGIEFGAYLSPWDRHQGSYGTSAYVDYYHSQWNELMSCYGPITEIWLDGANGGDGWYGGKPGKRTLPCNAWEYYQMPRLLDVLHERYPDAINFGGANKYSMMWPGNEKGYVPDEYQYVNEEMYWPPECDTPLRTKWFWHKDDQTKSLKELVTRYFQSVGRGGILNLGLSPNTDGLLDDSDVQRLKEFGKYIKNYNAVNYINEGEIVKEITKDGTAYRMHLKAPALVNAIDFKENLRGGMRISSWQFVADGHVLASGKHAGFRRIELFDATIIQNAELLITGCEGIPDIVSIALRHAPEIV